MFLLILISTFSTISLSFVLSIFKVYHPVSYTLSNIDYVTAVLYEFFPLTFMIVLLIIFKLNRIKIENNRTFDLIDISVILTITILSTIALFRALDVGIMVLFPSSIYSHGYWLRFTEIVYRILFYSSLSIILGIIVGGSLRINGLKTLLPIYIIPFFYTFNADIIMRANDYALFSVFTPLYQLIIEFGKFQTTFIGSLLNFLNFKASVFTQTFPFILIVANTVYSIDLPCIGWEGLIGYTIIFLNLIIDFEKSNKMRLIWGILGFFGTIIVNTIRLTLIFIIGCVFNVQAAMLVHQHAGDIIFIIWIFAFILLINKIKKSKPIRTFERLRSRLKSLLKRRPLPPTKPKTNNDTLLRPSRCVRNLESTPPI